MGRNARYLAVLGRSAVLILALSIPVHAQERLSSLAQVFSKGYLLQDRNDDGVVDFVALAIIAPREATAADAAILADIGARLGFETMGLDVPVVFTDSDPALPETPYVLLIGSKNRWVQRLVSEGRLDLATLSPGEGMIALLPSALEGRDALVIVGRDDDGLREAGHVFAARMPYLWRVGKETVKQIEEEAAAFFERNGLGRPSVAARVITVRRGAEEIASVLLEVSFGRATEVVQAAERLRELAAAHERHQREDVLNYAGVARLIFELRAGAEAQRVEVPRSGAPKRDPLPLVRESREPARELSLANIYSTEGLLKGSPTELIPNRVDTTIIVGPDREAVWAAEIAARLGLESTGVKLPISRMANEVKDEKSEINPILIGREHPFVRALRERGKLTNLAELQPNQGLVEIVHNAFDESPAVVVAGADEAGTREAARYLAARVPYLWEHKKGRLTFGMIEDEVRRFFAARSGAGQAATALYKLDRLIALELAGKEVESVTVNVYVENAEEGFARFVEDYVRPKLKAERVQIAATNIDLFHARPILDESWEIPWEVRDVWEVLRSRVLPRVKKKSRVEIEIRVSEAPEVRRELERAIRAELRRRGVAEERITVRVLSAYKQGFSWITDVVLPAIRERRSEIARIRIRFAPVEQEKDRPELRWQTIFSPIRWLQELYPIDEVLARELGLPVDAIVFEKAASPKSPIYHLEVLDRAGRLLYQGDFDPKFVVLPLFRQFPDYESVRVTTGWITADVDGRRVADERIVTDPEKFWALYQTKLLPRLFAYVMDLYEGQPKTEHAPYFGELRVELTLSEPDYPLGIDQEQISSLEALHEDIYFGTLAFFDLIGLKFVGERLLYPGRIIPIIYPPRHGENGRARIVLTGKAAGSPRVVLEWTERGKREKHKRSLDIPKVAIEDPRVVAAIVEAGYEGVRRVDVALRTDTERDEREELIKRAPEEIVDRTILSAEQARAMVEILRRFHQARLFTATLAYPQLDRLRIRFISPEQTTSEDLPNPGSTFPVKDIEARGRGYRHTGERIVQWVEPISPEACEEIIAKLSTFPEITAYWVGRSYLGRDIWAMDVMSPISTALWSHAKATTFKPTLFISGRQHANEVSSTSHILRLAELLATDPAYKKYLKRVNVVLHPITNPDGAALAYELQKITPHFMLHAGYWGALGVDVTVGQWERDPIYPETRVRREIWRTWLPDIFLNPHGYPSHEWVQLFGEYAGWVRSRVPERGRAWWAPRGWFIPGFSYVQDPRYPKHKDVAFALRDRIAEAINSDARLRELNRRMYARYRKYGVQWDPKTYKEDLHKGVRIYTAIKGIKPSPNAPSFMGRYPAVTVFESGTEAPDETARGEWLELVATAGLLFDLAHVQFLYESHYEVKRSEEEMATGVRFTVSRKRPVLPPQVETRAPEPSAR
ncbi:hypothetical protein HRbin10_02331 [bacterium HR10]|nr:hypothetical protein HRbin10_02331 [bacterium HR10]